MTVLKVTQNGRNRENPHFRDYESGPVFLNSLSQKDVYQCLNFLFGGYGLATMTGHIDDGQAVAIRNDALFRVLVYAGLRRSELCQLRRSDWYSESMTLLVRRGKGGKERVAVLADKTNTTRDLINELCRCHDWPWLVPSANHGHGSRLVDRHLSGDGVHKIVGRIGRAAGLARRLRPHDLRRTHITLALERGATIADVMAQVGHARAETTLRYAQAVDAANRRHRIAF